MEQNTVHLDRETNEGEMPQLSHDETAPTVTPAPRPWVKPTFERVPLKEALLGGATFFDGITFS